MANSKLTALYKMAQAGVEGVGDVVAKTSKAAQSEAMKMAAKPPSTAIEWKWKGAPKDRFSSGALDDMIYDAQEQAMNTLEDMNGADYVRRNLNSSVGLQQELYQLTDDYLRDTANPLIEQWSKGGLDYEMDAYGTLQESLEELDAVFDRLERANVPWEYTGRVYKAWPFLELRQNEAERISKAMSEMNDDQREIFLTLLKDDEGSQYGSLVDIEGLAETARLL